MTEVVALFDSRAEAQRAIDSLESAGYDAASVGYLNREAEADGNTGTGEVGEEAAKGVAGGAVGGAAVGAGTGLLAAAGLAIIPGIGPFLAAGTLLGTLGATAAGAAGGAVLGGAAGSIFGASSDTNEHGSYYRQGVDAGGSLVTVHVDNVDQAEVETVLRDQGARRINAHDDAGWLT